MELLRAMSENQTYFLPRITPIVQQGQSYLMERCD